MTPRIHWRIAILCISLTGLAIACNKNNSGGNSSNQTTVQTQADDQSMVSNGGFF